VLGVIVMEVRLGLTKNPLHPAPVPSRKRPVKPAIRDNLRPDLRIINPNFLKNLCPKAADKL